MARRVLFPVGMANQLLFSSKSKPPTLPLPDTRNAENAPAYSFSAEHALAQYVTTGCLNDTFYATAEMQLDAVLALCDQVSASYLAKLALYARSRGFLKDMPALLCALLTVRDPALCEAVFDRVIDDGKMLRTFVQIVRSGVVGRKSLGSLPKRLVRQWLANRDDATLFRASVGQSPSLADVVKMAHPRPTDAARRALYAWLIGKPFDVEALPPIVRDFESYKARPRDHALPDVPFQMLTALPLDRADWVAIAKRATWQQTRMNLNTFARHGVFEKKGMDAVIANRLRDGQAIAKARVLPHQLMMAYHAVDARVPAKVKNALEDAMERSLANVPTLPGTVYVCADVSGSMSSPLTGYRAGATSQVRCIDVAALLAAALLRTSDAEVIAFEHEVVSLELDARASVMANAKKLASVGGGGTSCSAPLAYLNRRRAKGEIVIFVSDNESWVDAGRGRATAVMTEWQAFTARNPGAQLVCIDLAPNRTTQAAELPGITNVGGFSDAVFELLEELARNGRTTDRWVQTIEREVIGN